MYMNNVAVRAKDSKSQLKGDVYTDAFSSKFLRH